MKTTKEEVLAIEEVALELGTAGQVELSEIELALIGGGQGDIGLA